MTFKEQIAADLENIFFNQDEFAESAVYAGVSVPVIETSLAEMNTSVPGFTLPMFSILVSAADVPRPKAGDAVTFRGVSCVVGPYPRSEGGLWQVDLCQVA